MNVIQHPYWGKIFLFSDDYVHIKFILTLILSTIKHLFKHQQFPKLYLSSKFYHAISKVLLYYLYLYLKHFSIQVFSVIITSLYANV